MKNSADGRLVSLDALRGFDMFWIIGGDAMAQSLARATDSGFFEWIALQTEHVAWNGFRFYDLIFPLFLFIAGVSFPFSLESRKAKGQSRSKIYSHIIQRGLILVALGIVYNGFFRLDFENLRYASVLGRIGLAWMFAALIFFNTGLKWRIVWTTSILLIYWAVMALVPVPGYGAGVYTMEGSLVAHIDRLFLPGVLYNQVHDPEGILSTLPAISTALLGMLTGQLLRHRNHSMSAYRKLGIMLLCGTSFILLALLWNYWFPINKNLWTSSFVLLTGGISLLLLSVFYLVTDIWTWRKWAFPFIVIGLNPITIYLCNGGMINFRSTAQYFFGGLNQFMSGASADFYMALFTFLVSWFFLYFLYKKKIFLKV